MYAHNYYSSFTYLILKAFNNILGGLLEIIVISILHLV